MHLACAEVSPRRSSPPRRKSRKRANTATCPHRSPRWARTTTLRASPRAASQSPLSSRLRICPEAGVAALARAVPIALEYRGVPGKTSSMLEYPTEVAFLHALRRVVPAVRGPPAIRVMPHRTHEREGAHGVRASVFHLGPAARKVFCFGSLTKGSTAVYQAIAMASRPPAVQAHRSPVTLQRSSPSRVCFRCTFGCVPVRRQARSG